jgi:membrane-bound lytic murein transglycosylase B
MKGFTACVALLICMAFAAVEAQDTRGVERDLRPEVEAFVGELVERDGFDAQELRALMANARTQETILDAMSRPSTSRPWFEYRPVYVNPQRVAAGLKFWSDNSATVARASRTYGVPEEIIVATIGVETLYGRNTGKFRVLDALYTLAFDYPPRAEYFRGELEQFLLLTREQRIDPTKPRGSYAGAMGLAQFMPSSYRKYAVDFDRSGRVDLTRDSDAIGSVANYMSEFGWEPDGLVAVPANVTGERIDEFLGMGWKPTVSVEALTHSGITPLSTVPYETEAALLKLQGERGPEYYLGFNNFYVITRYNRSVNYAMSVHELAQELKGARASESGLTAVKVRKKKL